MRMLPKLTPFLLQKSLQDLFLLTFQNEKNRAALRNVPHWQSHLLLVLGTFFKSGDPVCFDLCQKLLVTLLKSSVLADKKGYSSLDGCLSLRRVAPNGDSIVVSVLERLCADLKKHINQELNEASVEGARSSSANAIMVNNICILGFLIEDIIFERCPGFEFDVAMESLRAHIAKHEMYVEEGDDQGQHINKNAECGSEGLRMANAFLSLMDLVLWNNPKQTRHILGFRGGATPVPLGYTLLRLNMFLVDAAQVTDEALVALATRLVHLIPHLPDLAVEGDLQTLNAKAAVLKKRYGAAVELIKQGKQEDADVTLESTLSQEDDFVVMSEAVEVEAPARNDLAWTEVSSSAGTARSTRGILRSLAASIAPSKNYELKCLLKTKTASGLLTSPQSWEASSKLPLSAMGYFWKTFWKVACTFRI